MHASIGRIYQTGGTVRPLGGKEKSFGIARKHKFSTLRLAVAGTARRRIENESAERRGERATAHRNKERRTDEEFTVRSRSVFALALRGAAHAARASISDFD